MNLPNKITLVRILFVPAIIFLLLSRNIPSRYFFSLMLFFAASYTDYLDGYLARKLKKVTNFGKFLDPLADKMLIISVLICFVELKLIRALPVILIILREFMVTSLRLIASQKQKIISANYFGKLKTVSQMISIVFIMICQGIKEIVEKNNIEKSFYIGFMNRGCDIILWISVFLTIISGILYFYSSRECIK